MQFFSVSALAETRTKSNFGEHMSSDSIVTRFKQSRVWSNRYCLSLRSKGPYVYNGITKLGPNERGANELVLLEDVLAFLESCESPQIVLHRVARAERLASSERYTKKFARIPYKNPSGRNFILHITKTKMDLIDKDSPGERVVASYSKRRRDGYVERTTGANQGAAGFVHQEDISDWLYRVQLVYNLKISDKIRYTRPFAC